MCILTALSTFAFSGDAAAHSSRSGPPAPGIQIPGLTHGQMAVVVRYRSEILDLADAQAQTDLTFRRLLNHERLQFTYCLWGVMPGSISDEASPFNECSHAYLATLKALLDYMSSMPGDSGAAQRLVLQINDDMVRNGAAWSVCQFSGETYSTGEVIRPHWLRHPPSLIALVFALVMLGLPFWWLFRRPKQSVQTCRTDD